MAVSDYLVILEEHPGQWLSAEQIARNWNAAHPSDTRSPDVVRNALRKRGRPDVLIRFDMGKSRNYRFKRGVTWKPGMCKHCQDPVKQTIMLCRRCR